MPIMGTIPTAVAEVAAAAVIFATKVIKKGLP